jgi:hypothetical protein
MFHGEPVSRQDFPELVADSTTLRDACRTARKELSSAGLDGRAAAGASAASIMAHDRRALAP